MSDGTGISWTDATWNPVVGCTRVSAGCDHCYAVTMSHRIGAAAEADVAAGREPGAKRNYVGLTVLNGKGERHFNGTVRCVEEALPIPLRWRKPRRIFVNSMGDLFHRDVPFEFIARVFAVMALCPQHTFQVLTKRPERMAAFMSMDGLCVRLGVAARQLIGRSELSVYKDGRVERAVDAFCDNDGVLPNVWLGVSAEDQATWDARVSVLAGIPATVRFVSVEPMLGPICTRRFVYDRDECIRNAMNAGWCPNPDQAAASVPTVRIYQVIVGGESGPGARPFNLQWGIDVIRQCRAAGVAVFFKQTGAVARVDYYTGDDDLREWALDRRHTVWNSDGLGPIGGVEGVSKWTPRDGQPRLGSVIDVPMGGDSTNPEAWPEDLRVQEWPEVKG